MPRTEQQFEAIRELRREQILEVALELFASHGFHPTSIGLIAEKAGISKGLMYNYFESKEELVLAIIEKGRSRLMESFDANRDGILTSDEFLFHINENFELLSKYLPYWKLYFAILMQPSVYRMAREKSSIHLLRQRLLFEDYFRKKGVPDPVSEAVYFDVVFDGICINYIMDPESFPLESMKKMITDRFK